MVDHASAGGLSVQTTSTETLHHLKERKEMCSVLAQLNEVLNMKLWKYIKYKMTCVKVSFSLKGHTL